MLEWLRDEDEMRQRPIRTLGLAALTGFFGVGAIVYFGAAERSLRAGLTAGLLSGIGLPLVFSRLLWPGVDARSGAALVGAAAVVARWHFTIVCVLLGVALAAFGVARGDTGIAVAGVPFIALAALLWLVRRRLAR
jgi:hypothetical protein